MTTPSALPENHILQVPMSFTPAAFLDAPFRWRGHELNLLSIKETDGVAEPLPVWKGFAVREGAIIAIAGLILASSYLLRPNLALAFLKNSGLRTRVVLVTAVTVAVREIAFIISRKVTSNLIKNGCSPKTEPSLLQYVRLKAAQTNVESYISTLTLKEDKNPKTLAYALYHLCRNSSFQDQLKEYTECLLGIDLLAVFSHLFSPTYRSNLSSKSNKGLLDAPATRCLYKVCLERAVEYDHSHLYSNVERTEPLFRVLIEHSKQYRRRSIEGGNTLYVLGVLHKALVEAGLSIVEDQGHKGITREFYNRFVNHAKVSDVLPSFDRFLDMVPISGSISCLRGDLEFEAPVIKAILAAESTDMSSVSALTIAGDIEGIDFSKLKKLLDKDCKITLKLVTASTEEFQEMESDPDLEVESVVKIYGEDFTQLDFKRLDQLNCENELILTTNTGFGRSTGKILATQLRELLKDRVIVVGGGPDNSRAMINTGITIRMNVEVADGDFTQMSHYDLRNFLKIRDLPFSCALSGNIKVRSLEDVSSIRVFNYSALKGITVSQEWLYLVQLESHDLLQKIPVKLSTKNLSLWGFGSRSALRCRNVDFSGVEQLYIKDIPDIDSQLSVYANACGALQKRLRKGANTYLDYRRELNKYSDYRKQFGSLEYREKIGSLPPRKITGDFGDQGTGNICAILGVDELREFSAEDLDKFPSIELHIKSGDTIDFPFDKLSTLKSQFRAVELVYPEGDEAVESLIPKLVKVFEGKTENLLIGGNVAYLGSDCSLSLYNLKRKFEETSAALSGKDLSGFDNLEKVDLGALLDRWFFGSSGKDFKPCFLPSDKKPLMHLIKEMVRGKAYPDLEGLWGINYQALIRACDFLGYEGLIEEFQKHEKLFVKRHKEALAKGASSELNTFVLNKSLQDRK